MASGRGTPGPVRYTSKQPKGRQRHAQKQTHVSHHTQTHTRNCMQPHVGGAVIPPLVLALRCPYTVTHMLWHSPSHTQGGRQCHTPTQLQARLRSRLPMHTWVHTQQSHTCRPAPRAGLAWDTTHSGTPSRRKSHAVGRAPHVSRAAGLQGLPHAQMHTHTHTHTHAAPPPLQCLSSTSCAQPSAQAHPDHPAPCWQAHPPSHPTQLHSQELWNYTPHTHLGEQVPHMPKLTDRQRSRNAQIHGHRPLGSGTCKHMVTLGDGLT